MLVDRQKRLSDALRKNLVKRKVQKKQQKSHDFEDKNVNNEVLKSKENA